MNDITKMTDEEIEAFMARRKVKAVPVRDLKKGWPKSPTGWWTVTTYGDCEGRTYKNLGTFKGHVVDIALSLAGKAMYDLCFVPAVNPAVLPEIKPDTKGVKIQLGIESGTWDMGKEECAKSVEKWLNTEIPQSGEFEVDICSYYAAVTVVRK